jgi:hypothetical protein
MERLPDAGGVADGGLFTLPVVGRRGAGCAVALVPARIPTSSAADIPSDVQVFMTKP